MARQSRKRAVEPDTFLTPIDIRDFGDFEKDPCFGKLYDLGADECQICGDFELCAIAFAQRQNQKRIEAEKETKTKDLELNELDFRRALKKYYEGLVFSGKYSKIRALRKTARRHHITLVKTKSLLKE